MSAPTSYENNAAAQGPASTVATEGGSANIFVCPVVGALDISGNASLTTLQQVSVSIAYDDRYDIEINGNALVSSFALDGSGSTFAVNWSDGTGAQFAGVMKSVIDGAEKSGKTLSKLLGDEMLNTFKAIFADTLPNLLESEWSLAHDVKSTEAAADMQGKLTAGPREIIAQQLPESNYAAYMDASENPTTANLPLVNGDTLVFVFDVNENLVVRTDKKTAGTTTDAASGVTEAGAPAGAGAAATGPYGETVQGIQYLYKTRRVAFYVKVNSLAH
jgi:hypothetical protein